MSSVLFITGTDTGVGKTLLTAMLLAHMRSCGARALALKPVCSGSLRDVNILNRVQDGALPIDRINRFYIPEPVAPLAVPIHRRPKIRLRDLLDSVQRVRSECDILLVEGIGGVMVPLGRKLMVRDWISSLGCSVILVARNRLGAINQTLSALKCLEGLNLPRVTVVLMDSRSSELAATTNPRILKDLIAPLRLIQIPFVGTRAGSPDAIERNSKRFKKTLALVAKVSIF